MAIAIVHRDGVRLLALGGGGSFDWNEIVSVAVDDPGRPPSWTNTVLLEVRPRRGVWREIRVGGPWSRWLLEAVEHERGPQGE